MKRPQPRSRSTLPLLTLAIAGLTAAPPAAADAEPAPDPRAPLARQLHEKVQALHQLRQQRQQEQAAFDQHHAALVEQLDRLKRDVAAIEPGVEKDRAVVADLQKRLADHHAALAASRATLSAAADSAATASTAMAQRVAAGVPFQRDERRARLQKIAANLRSNDLGVQSAALSDFYANAGEELRLATAIQLTNRPVLLDDGRRRIDAYVLRLGLVHEAFVSEDGATSGLASHTAQTPWRLTTLDDPLRHVFAVARQHKPAQLLHMPLVLAPAGGAK